MDESKAAQQAVKLMVNEIYKAVDNGINNAKFDVTKKATTSSVLADNIYQIQMDGEIYKIQGRKAFSFKAGDVVDVLIPENNLTNMYIAEGKAGLDKRRSGILNSLANSGDYRRYERETISTRDLAYLSADADVEFALFRSKNEDILIRGTAQNCNIIGDLGDEILEHRYEWVAHSHVDRGVLVASPADRETLKKLKQNKSTLVGIDGQELKFHQSEFDD